MFNFFKTRKENREKLMERIKDSEYVAAECHYTVGTDIDDKIVLRVGGDVYNTMTLTMNDAATRQLIRMLTAALPEQEEE